MRGCKPKHTPYPIEQLMKQSKSKSKVRDWQIASIIKQDRCTVNVKMNRSDFDWKLGELALICCIVGVDIDELINAIRKDIEIIYDTTNKKYRGKRG